MRTRLAFLALTLSLAAAGCGDDMTCAAGTVAEGSSCVPACTATQVWDDAAGACAEISTFCADGSTWSATAAACVPDDDLLVADVTESTEPNDPTFGGTAGTLTVPAVGAAVVVGGTIAAPADIDDDGYTDPDFDVFELTVAAPTLLRITADGVGGASSGFIVFADDDLDDATPDVTRGAIGTSTDGAARDLYLPRAGTYSLVAGDAQNLMTYYVYEGSTFVGGGEMGYFITVEQLAIPSATALTFAPSATADGTWGATPPATGTAVGFYSVPQAVNTIYNYELASTGDASPDMIGTSGGALVVGGSSGMIVSEAASNVDVVVDFVLTFGVEFTYDFTVAAAGLAVVSAAQTSTINQPAFDELNGDSMPFRYFGLSATAGEMVALDVESDNGWVFAEITSPDMTTSYGYFTPDGDVNQTIIRFLAPTTGLYLINILSVETVGNFFGYYYGDAETFELTLAVNRGAPTATGALPFSGGGVLTTPAWEKYYTYTPAASQAITIDPGAHDVALYDNTGALLSSASGEPLLYVADTTPTALIIAAGDFIVSATPGTLALGVNAVTVVGLGNVTTAAALNANQAGTYFTFTAGGAGRATVNVTPPGGADITIYLLDSTFQVVDTIDVAGTGLTETAIIDVPAAATPQFLQISGSAGPHAFNITFATFPAEDASNNTAITADAVTDFITATLTAGDVDWFTFTLAATTTVTISTEAYGSPAAGDTQLTLYLDDGTTQIGFDDDGGAGYYSSLTSYLPAGDYLVKVNGYSATTTGGYALRIE